MMGVKDLAENSRAWEVRVPPAELKRPHEVQEVLRRDPVPPAPTLLEKSDYDLGTAPLDVERYISKEFHAREVDKLWSKAWQYAVWTHDIPNPGDVHVYRIVDRSVLIVRQPDLSLKAFVNSCLHRGTELCKSDVHRAQLRCPYHGFTWSLQGELKWVPSQWDFPQVTPEKYSLPQVRVDEWNGFIFINFDENAVPLKEYMGGMYAQWGGEHPQGAWDFRSKYKAVHLNRIINCNWKVCMEGFLESLHVLATHPQVATMVADSSAQYDVYPNEPHFSRYHALTGIASSMTHNVPTDQEILDSFTASYLPEHRNTDFGKLREGETARMAFGRLARDAYGTRLGVDVSKLPDAELIDGTQYLLFPNFAPWPSLLNPIVYRFRPLNSDPDWSIWETMFFLPFEGDRPPSCKIIDVGPDESFEDYNAMGALDKILQQDAIQLPLVQRGLKASTVKKVTLSQYQEARIRHYNQTLDEYLKR